MTDNRIKPITGPPHEPVRNLSLEAKTYSFLAGFFRHLQESFASMAVAAGETMPAMKIKMETFSEAFEISAAAVDWAREPVIQSSSEIADDMASPIVEMLNTMMRSTTRAYNAGQDGKSKNGNHLSI